MQVQLSIVLRNRRSEQAEIAWVHGPSLAEREEIFTPSEHF